MKEFEAMTSPDGSTDGPRRIKVRSDALPKAEWPVGPVDDFDPEGDNRSIVRVNGRDVVVFKRGDRFYALDNTCLHMGGPVGEGILIGKVEAVVSSDRRYLGERFSETEIHIVCPWHGYEYNIETGAFAADPKLRLKTYPIVERDGFIYVID